MTSHLRVQPFKWYSLSEYSGLRQMMLQSEIITWMERVRPLTPWGYIDWIRLDPSSLLYGIFKEKNVAGFVYFYTESEVINRIKQLGLMTDKPVLEISFAKNNQINEKGFMTDGVECACKLAKQYYQQKSLPVPEIYAFINPNNEKAIRLVEKAGFSGVGFVPYHEAASSCDLAFKYCMKKLSH